MSDGNSLSEKLQELPPERVAEVETFVDFIAAREANRQSDRAAADERRARWLAENREAMDDWNEYVEANGLPLAHYRTF